MPQDRVSNDEFLSRLGALLVSTHSKAHGSIYLTQKAFSQPLAHDTEAASAASTDRILIRATNGLSKAYRTAKPSKSKDAASTKIKLATVVDAADLESFYARYAEVCKKGMEGLRKRDKKKAKERAKLRKKGKTAASVPAAAGS